MQRSLDSNNDIELLPGGFPIKQSNKVVGGIGISGGNFEQDQSIAEYAVRLLNEQEN